MLRQDLDAPKKQRHTARRVLARLVDEHDAGELTYSTVRDYVAKRRPEIWCEAGRQFGEGFVPQTHEPGAEGEVDFADLWIILRGIKTKVSLFTLRLSCSAKSVHRASMSQGQEAFLEGHVHAFEQLGGLPGRIRYDNLKSAVRRVLFGRDRDESERWIAFRSHYGFDAFYCLPGIEGAHEKGGVEGEVGRFRRWHCVPMPVVDSIEELNLLFATADAKDDHRRIENRAHTVGHDFAFEKTLWRPLPTNRKEPIKIYAHVLRHPTEGFFLVDTGVSKRFAQDPKSVGVGLMLRKYAGIQDMHTEPSTAQIVEGEGAPLKGVFMTHLHLDHVSGFPDIPNDVPIYVGAHEAEASLFLNLLAQGTNNNLLRGRRRCKNCSSAKTRTESSKALSTSSATARSSRS
jgi:transposase